MTWKNIGFRQDRRFAPRHVLYITAAFHMADVQACVAPRARALSRDMRFRSEKRKACCKIWNCYVTDM